MTASAIQQQRLLIVDFGSQYTQLIARRVREAGVYCEIRPFDLSAQEITEFAPRGVILSGGPESVTGELTPRIHEQLLDLNVPILAICYGMQALAQQLGGAVTGSDQREFGHADVEFLESSVLFGDPHRTSVWMSHGDKVVTLPEGFVRIGSSDSAPIAAMMCQERQIYAVQFHPEVTHTEQGSAWIARFARDICGCDALWTPQNIADDAIAQIKAKVGSGRVLLGLSGGVVSSVVAALAARANGDQLTCVFVDNGLLRKGEREQVEQSFAPSNALSLNLVVVDARDEFLQRLEGEADPEAKRKIIGNTFVEVFERESTKLKGIEWLAQGTIYPDVIESAASKYGKAHVIKSHHNVGGLPEHMSFKLLEPLRELFKDEVREVGVALGLPREMVYRHPFPGPGLGVRILGEVRAEYAAVLREADAIFIEELRRADLYDAVSQAFAVYLPVKSVGVVGDARRYEHVIALRAVVTTDFMTATWAELPYAFIGKVSNRIINEIEQVSRVVYDVSSKPPGTIEWE